MLKIKKISFLPKIKEQLRSFEKFFFPLKPMKEKFDKKLSVNIRCIITLMVLGMFFEIALDNIISYKKM